MPMTKRCTINPKVICGGNCRKYELRVSGRRNSLGALLTKREDEWFSGTMPPFAVVFRHNTHTAPNYRVPMLPQTHDPECNNDCLKKHTVARMTAAAQRGQRNSTGYYSGYIQKRQPVGKFALRQAARNLQSLPQSIAQRSYTQQYHHVACRMLGDLEYRGHVRPATEESNLAANYKEKDVCFAEFIRTFETQAFYGGSLLQRSRRELETVASEHTTCHRVRVPMPGSRQKDQADVNFDDSYGFRGNDARVYFLNPWEFTKIWCLEELRPPSWYRFRGRTPHTMDVRRCTIPSGIGQR